MTKAPSSKSNAMCCAEWRARKCATPESAASFRKAAAQSRADRRTITKGARREQDAQQGRRVHQEHNILRAYERTLQEGLAFSSNLFGSLLHRQPEMLEQLASRRLDTWSPMSSTAEVLPCTPTRLTPGLNTSSVLRRGRETQAKLSAMVARYPEDDSSDLSLPESSSSIVRNLVSKYDMMELANDSKVNHST